MGATTLTVGSHELSGRLRMTQGTGLMSSSYATGGDSFTARALGLRTVTRLVVNNTEGGYMLAPNTDNLTILAYEAGADGNSLDQVGATSDLSAEAFDWVAYGT